MKILIVGLGSIGRRHMSILQSKKNITLAALRSRKGTLSKASEITEFENLDDALNFKPDGVIISTPTSCHIGDALPFLEQGCKVLIEKPISQNLAETVELQKYKEQIRVAYCMRFLPIYIKLRQVFIDDIPFKVGFRRSYFLPKWHPYAVYQEEYTARKELGGGALRTLSHEIDLAIHWFGDVENISGLTDKISHLELDVDDYAFFSVKFKTGTRTSFELDFFSPININEGNANTVKGQYRWDMNSIEFCDYKDDKYETLYQTQDQDINQMYISQMEDFIGFIQDSKSSNASFSNAIETMTIIKAVDE